MRWLLLLCLIWSPSRAEELQPLAPSFQIITFVVHYDCLAKKIIQYEQRLSTTSREEWIRKHGPITLREIKQFRVHKALYVFQVLYIL